MADFECSSCGHYQLVDDKHIGRKATCPKCNAQGVVARPSIPAIPSVSARHATSPAETVFYESGGVHITNTRAVINNTTYALNNITSVRCTATRLTNWKRVACVLPFVGFSLLLLLPTFGSLTTGEFFPFGVGCGVASIVLWSLGIAIGHLVPWNVPHVYRLTIGTAGTDRYALESEHSGDIQPIVDALNAAIVARG